MVERGNTSSTFVCATTLGFRNRSRLCHTCNATSRRQSNDRCTKCPDDGQNWGLIVLGFFVTLLVLCFVVRGAIGDAGKQSLSSAVKKITLNYLQVAALALAFPLRWPPALESLFEFQSAVSTVGEALINPDCLAKSSSPASLFYNKQAGFAAMPFIAVLVAFAFWFVYGSIKATPFFDKRKKTREGEIAVSTPKDKFVVTVTVVVYLIFPTLCSQAFQIFDCKTIAGVQYLAVDLEHPCYTGDHLAAVLTLGVGQLVVFVVGLPLLMLLFLRRNRVKEGGLNRHVVRVRYGLFFSAYQEDTYFWEIVLTSRKIGIVAISVFGRSIGTQRQALLAICILLVCILLEIVGKPYQIVTDRHNILSRLELASLFSLWGTMWCGMLIFASQAPGEEDFVIFLSVVVATANVSMMLWLISQLVSECAHENKDSKFGTAVLKRVQSIRDRTLRRRSSAESHSVNDVVADITEIGIELAAKDANPLRTGIENNTEEEKPASGRSVEVTNPAFSCVVTRP